jgi:hypothetical protein
VAAQDLILLQVLILEVQVVVELMDIIQVLLVLLAKVIVVVPEQIVRHIIMVVEVEQVL